MQRNASCNAVLKFPPIKTGAHLNLGANMQFYRRLVFIVCTVIRCINSLFQSAAFLAKAHVFLFLSLVRFLCSSASDSGRRASITHTYTYIVCSPRAMSAGLRSATQLARVCTPPVRGLFCLPRERATCRRCGGHVGACAALSVCEGYASLSAAALRSPRKPSRFSTDLAVDQVSAL